MNRTQLFLLFFCLSSVSLYAQETFTIGDVIQRAHTQSPIFKQAETRRENRYWQYRYYRTNYNPQVRLSSYYANTGVLYNNSVFPVRQEDGSVQYLQVNQFNPGARLSLDQPVQWTGGTISLSTKYNYLNDYVAKSTQWIGSIYNIEVNQPIFSFNRYKWDRRIEPIKYEESKREYAESMEEISRDAVNYFFNVMEQQVNQQIAQYNLANNDTIYKIEQGRFNIGTTSQDKLLQVELQLLRSRQDVAQAKLDLQNARLMLRSFIGLRNGELFDLVLPEEIPLFAVSEDQALVYARETRAAFIAFQRRKTEAEAAVAQAKGTRYEVGVTGAFGLNNDGSQLSDIYQDPSRQQIINVNFNIPLIDWGRRNAMMKSAYANKRLNDYLIAQDEVLFEQEILTQVRQFEMLQLQIEITRKADQVAFERYKVAQNRYLIGKIDITNLNIALTEKDNAKRSYLQALKSFWIAYYNLRRLTLFDFAESKYLYNPLDKDDR